MLKIVILAAGEGTRLYTETSDFPKPLFFYKTKPIIAHLIDEYKKHSNDITIVYSNELLRSWLEVYYPSLPLKFVYAPPSGTMQALSKVSDLNGEILLSWADFILESNFVIPKTTWFGISKEPCRYSVNDGLVEKKPGSFGIFGLFYFTNFPSLDLTKEDFVDLFVGTHVDTQSIKIKDLGTINSLIKHDAFSISKERYFNSLEFTDTTVIKRALTPEGIKLQKLECDWYAFANTHMPSLIPQVHNMQDKLILDKLEGQSVCDSNIITPEFWNTQLPNLLNKLHIFNLIPNEQDCIETYVLKAKARVKQVQKFIDTWFNGNYTINGKTYTKLDLTIPDECFIPKRFTFIHGDLQFSNLFDNNGVLKILDPRGYFGTTKLFGDPMYDIAKLAYAVDGYDTFNTGDFGLYKDMQGNTFFIHQSSIPMTAEAHLFFMRMIHKYGSSTKVLNFILASIWFSLTSYIINNPRAIIGAYCKALIRNEENLF